MPPQGAPALKFQQTNFADKTGDLRQVARELHWLEKLNIVGQLSLVVVGTIAALIYGSQLRTMKRQLEVMNKQVTLSQEQLEASQRAWIEVTEFVPVTYNWSWWQVSVYGKMSLKNVGNILATQVHVWAELQTSESRSLAHPELSRFQRDACQKGRVGPGGRPLGRVQTIYPSEVGTDQPIVPTSMLTDVATTHVRDYGKLDLYIVGCVYYSFSTSQTVHTTPFIYQVRHKLTDDKSTYPVIGEKVSTDHMFFDDWLSGEAINDAP
jgi:hypothetical protein